jgi:beta-fructofuranosidase
MMSLPRVMNLDSDGTLRLHILPQTAALRAGTITVERSAASTQATLPEASGEVILNGVKRVGFTFTISTATAELLHVDYSAEKHTFTAEGKETPIEADDAPTLHVFVDGSVIELILGQRMGYTKRFYYTESTAPDIIVRTDNRNAKMSAWKVDPISSNRLTTPAQNT